MVFLGMILGFIVSKEGKLSYPKKRQAIVTCHHLGILNRFKYSMGWHSLTKKIYQKPCCYHGTYH
jgi:hypothetical protein